MAWLDEILPALAGSLAITTVLFLFGRIIYRLYFDPLSQIPGPRLNHASYAREIYYNIWKNGKWHAQFRKDHEKYGPIIRLNPDEVHISDPDFYDKIYHVGTKFARSHWFYQAFNMRSMITATSMAEHRFLRAPFEAFFSQANVMKLQPSIQARVDHFVSRADAAAESGELFNFHFGSRAVTTDVVMDLVCGGSLDLLGMDDFGKPYTDAVGGGSLMLFMIDAYISRYIPRVLTPPITRLIHLIPRSYLRTLQPDQIGFMYLFFHAEKELFRLAAMTEEEREKEVDSKGEVKRDNIFKELLRSNKLAERGLDLEYAAGEAFVIFTGGVESTASTMTKTLYEIVKNPEINNKVFAELKEAFPNPDSDMPYSTLMTLPYFTACMKEGLRVADAIPARLNRIVPEGGITYDKYFIPAGTRISMSAYIQHKDEKIFPEHAIYQPDRWSGEEGQKRETYLIPFSKGSNSCIGRLLAAAELYMTLAKFIRRYELETVGVDDWDMVPDVFYLAGMHSKAKKRMQVRLKRRKE